MQMRVGDRIGGFRVERIRNHGELNGRLVEMTHERVKTRLLWLENGAENKLFSIAFRTLPFDSSGVFHILEHSVLNGSKKYPVREPFVELLKSSMNTYLNASTFQDKTLYPVSSRNGQDFLNLVGVYLDAVFAPLMLKDEFVFLQEGWHIEENGGEYLYKGVVFNEMKGALGSVARAIDQKIGQMLFPAHPYGFVSGGDPEAIPLLSYPRFCEAYRAFYHPSNACVYLDGSVPLEATLALIDEYLSRYEESRSLPSVPAVNPAGSEETAYYEISPSEPMENRAHLALARVFCRWNEIEKVMAANILTDVLAGSNDACLKRAVLEKRLARDITLTVEDSLLFPYITIDCADVADGKEDELRAVICETAQALIRDGLDRDSIFASINRYLFRLRDPREPSGLMRAINAAEAVFNGGDPLEALTLASVVSGLRQKAETGYFESLVKALLLEEEGLAVLHMLPSRTLGEERREAENARLAHITSAWSKAQREENRRLIEALRLRQRKPDSPESLAALPVLPVSAVSEMPEFTRTIAEKSGGAQILRHPLPSFGLVHTALYFRLTDFSLDELTRLGLLPGLLGSLPAAGCDSAQLQKQIKSLIGRLEYSIEAFPNLQAEAESTPYFVVRMSVLRENLPAAARLISDILCRTDFSPVDRVREIVMQEYEGRRQRAISAGHIIGINAVMSSFSADYAVREAVYGKTALLSLKALKDNFESEAGSLVALLSHAQKTAFVVQNALLSITGDAPVSPDCIFSALAQGRPSPEKAVYALRAPARIGVRIPASVGYGVQGVHLSRMGKAYHPSLRVAENIFNYGHLWNGVRVKGGAYGAGALVSRFGGIFAYSYRDPTPLSSLEIFASMGEALRAFIRSGEDIGRHIVSTVSGLEPLRTPAERGRTGDANWLSGITYEEALENRRRLLATDEDALRYAAEVFDAFCEKGAACIVAGDAILKNCRDFALEDL